MVRFMMAALTVVGGLLAASPALAAAEGFATTDVNMRAGPSTEYPRILVLQRGAPLTVYGCVRGYSWCDVGYYHERGWVSSRYISLFYDDRRVYAPYIPPRVNVPIVTFSFNYWDTWYPRYPWYRDYRWRRDRPDADYWRRRDDDRDIIIRPDRRNNDRIERRNDDRRDRLTNRDNRPVFRDDTIRVPGAGGQRRDDRGRAERPQTREERRDQRRDAREDRQRRGEQPQRRDNQERGNRQRNERDCVWVNGKCVLPN